MKIKKSKKFSNPIIYTKCFKNGSVMVADSKTTIRILDKSTLDLMGGFKVGINHVWYKKSVISFSDDGNYFATISEDAKTSRAYNAKTKKAIAKIERHKGNVSCVAIDPHGKYFFSCGEDGKTFVSDIKSGKLSFTLPAHVDEVNDIVFCQNNQYVATCSYDKQISIFNYALMTPLVKLKAHSSAVMKMKFLSEHRLFSIDKSGSAIIWDLTTKKVITRLTGIHDDILHVTANDDFIFLGSQLGFIMVYELVEYEQISRKLTKFSSAITSLEYDNASDNLIIGCEDGSLNFLYIYEGDKHLEQLLENEEYDAMQEFVAENPLLEFTKPYIVLSTIWEKTIQKASQLLQSSKANEAKAAFGVFQKIPSKNTIMKKMLQEYGEFDKFVLMVKKGNVALAYSMANQHKTYKDSKVYLALEARWKKLFAQAQKLAIEPRGKEKAMELLKSYRGVSEKTKHIQEMLSKSDIYIRFKNAIAKKEFKVLFELVKVNPFLKEFKEYDMILTFGDNLYIKSSKCLQDDDMHTAIKLLRILRDFPDFEEDAKKMILDIESQGKFIKAVEEDDFNIAYNLLSNSSILAKTAQGHKLEKMWLDDFNIAEVYATNGDILGIDGVMSKYKGVSSKNMLLVNVYAWAYTVQIENAIKRNKEQVIIEKGIKSYILYFGLDDHIESTFDIYEAKYGSVKLNLESLRKGSRSMWRVSMRVHNILE